jgi:prepilin-type N-terminal cleavage/methylation domain-containing protein
MLKKILRNQKGLTFIELMIAIAIIVIISSISVLYIRGDIIDEIEMTTDQLAADIRLTRNMAVSRTTYDFGGGAGLEYPAGGYGIYTDKAAGTYTIFAESSAPGVADGYDVGDDGIVKVVTLENNLIKIGDAYKDSVAANSYFTFKSETEATTDLIANSGTGKFRIEIDYSLDWPAQSYRGILTLGEDSDDGLVLVSLGKDFEEYQNDEPYNPPDPVGGGKFKKAIDYNGPE